MLTYKHVFMKHPTLRDATNNLSNTIFDMIRPLLQTYTIIKEATHGAASREK